MMCKGVCVSVCIVYLAQRRIALIKSLDCIERKYLPKNENHKNNQLEIISLASLF